MSNIKIILSLIFLYPVIGLAQQYPVIEWSKFYGGSVDDYPYDVKQTTDGGYIVVGYTESTSLCFTSRDGDIGGNNNRVGTKYWALKLNADGDTLWTRCYGGSGLNRGQSVQQIASGGYIIAGKHRRPMSRCNYTDSFGIIWTDANGDTTMTRCYGGTGTQHPYSIEKTSDGGYVIAGGARVISDPGDVWGWHAYSTYRDFWVVRISAGADTLWTRCLGGYNVDEAFDIKQTSDGGYIVAGYTKSDDGDVTGKHGGTDNADMWIVKIGSDGNIAWSKCFGGTGNDYAESIVQTTDGGYIVAGYTGSDDGDVWGNHSAGQRDLTHDAWVLKLNANGDTTWTRCYGSGCQDKAYSIQQTTDGGYVFAAQAQCEGGDVWGHESNNGYDDFWIVKLEPDGDTSWTKCFGSDQYSTDIPYSIQETTDQGFILAGSATGHIGERDYWILKLCTHPNIIIPTNTIHDGENEFWSAYETITVPEPLGSFIIENGGNVELKAGVKIKIDPFFNAQQGSYFYAHIGAVPCLPGIPTLPTVSENVNRKEENSVNEEINVFPNPTVDEVNIYFDRDLYGETIQIELFNLMGRLIFSKSDVVSGNVRIDISLFPDGLYILRTTLDTKVCVDKIIKN